MFTVGDFSIEIVSHFRVVQRSGVPVNDILNRPRQLGRGGILEQFDVRAFHQGQPLAWGSRGQHADFPDEQHREIIEWVGREVVDVRAAFDAEVGGNELTPEQAADRIEHGLPVFTRKVGTKRGADFRTRFFRNLMTSLRKAHAARTLGKTVSEVTDEEYDRSEFTEPVTLRGETVDSAVEILTGRTPAPEVRR